MAEHKYPVPRLTSIGEKLKEDALIAYDREVFELRNRLAKVLATIWENHQAKGKDDD